MVIAKRKRRVRKKKTTDKEKNSERKSYIRIQRTTQRARSRVKHPWFARANCEVSSHEGDSDVRTDWDSRRRGKICLQR